MTDELEVECINCGHERQDHFDRAGCTVETAINLHAAHTHYERCHCTNFQVFDQKYDEYMTNQFPKEFTPGGTAICPHESKDECDCDG